MIIGLTGATGFIASHLIPVLRERGHTCIAFSRNPERAVAGCRETRVIHEDRAPDLSELDVVVNLAGESIQGKWSAAKRQRIRNSRVMITRQLVWALRGSPVRTLISTSATGFYGDRADAELDETSSAGTGFLADVCREWEAAALAAQERGVRVCVARVGFVVAARGGAMDKLRPVFKAGLGGRLGSGRQWMPWIHVDDVCGIMAHLIATESVQGVFNATAPTPVTNADFTRALGHALHRPAFFHVPEFALRLALGDLASVALESTRALPHRTVESGYVFTHSELASALT